MNMMNRAFINRNRIFRMNSPIPESRTLINEYLFTLPEGIASRDEIVVDLIHSDEPNAIGVMSYMNDGIREYYAYKNDEFGVSNFKEKTDTFKDALFYAKEVYKFIMGNSDSEYNKNEKTYKR